jgi:outer membrane protein assembly factor BamB
MMSVKRTSLLLVAACLALTACDTFGTKKSKASPEEIKERRTINELDEKLVPDPRFAATTVELPPPVAMKDWPQAGVTASKLTGNIEAGPAFQIAWRQDIGAGSDVKHRIVAAPVAKDGRLYTIDADQKVAAWEAASGRRIWQKELPSSGKKDKFAVGGGLAIAGDKLIVPSGYGYVMALKLEDGAEVWRKHTESPMSGSPAIMGERAFVTSTNNEVYAFDINTGEIVWTDQAIAESARVLSSPSPAVNGDLLVAPFSSGELIAYLPANGKRLWGPDTLTTSGRYTPMSAINDIAGRPSIQDGVVYAASYSGMLVAIDARSGARLWDKSFGSRLGPVVGGDYLFVVGTEGQVICVSKVDGGIVWVRNLPEFKKEKQKKGRIVWNGPLLASNRLVIVSSEGKILALSPQTGETVSEIDLKKTIYIDPIAADGKIFVLADDGQLVAIR